MGLRAQQAVKAQSRATGSTRTVELALADYASEGGEQWIVFVKNTTLHKDWGLSDSVIYRALRELNSLGEIRRRPDLERELGRQRVYELIPGGSLQLALPLETSSESKADRVSGRCQTPSRLARARHEGTEGTGEQLPPSPQGGVPSAPGSREPRRATRRRRPHRGADTGATAGYEWITEPCPLLEGPAKPVPEAALSAWEQVSRAIKTAVGELTYDVWFGDNAHVHEGRDGLLVVAFRAESLSWIEGRYSMLLERIQDQLQQRLALVACEALSTWSYSLPTAVSA